MWGGMVSDMTGDSRGFGVLVLVLVPLAKSNSQLMIYFNRLLIFIAAHVRAFQ